MHVVSMRRATSAFLVVCSALILSSACGTDTNNSPGQDAIHTGIGQDASPHDAGIVNQDSGASSDAGAPVDSGTDEDSSTPAPDTGMTPLQDSGSMDADGGTQDAIPSDASAHDGAVPETGPTDTGPSDTGLPEDTGVVDTGPPDTGVPHDTGVVDTGPPDTGIPDDTGVVDTGPPDTGIPLDTGVVDTGPPDTGVPEDTGVTDDAAAMDAAGALPFGATCDPANDQCDASMMLSCHLFGQLGDVCTKPCVQNSDCPVGSMGQKCSMMGFCRP
jgi:hypothetical protein